MYDEKIRHREKRTVHTDDLESGELLLIGYFPDADVFTINGILVIRAHTYEDTDGLTVFVRRTDKKLFTVLTSSLAKLHI